MAYKKTPPSQHARSKGTLGRIPKDVMQKWGYNPDGSERMFSEIVGAMYNAGYRVVDISKMTTVRAQTVHSALSRHRDPEGYRERYNAYRKNGPIYGRMLTSPQEEWFRTRYCDTSVPIEDIIAQLKAWGRKRVNAESVYRMALQRGLRGYRSTTGGAHYTKSVSRKKLRYAISLYKKGKTLAEVKEAFQREYGIPLNVASFYAQLKAGRVRRHSAARHPQYEEAALEAIKLYYDGFSCSEIESITRDKYDGCAMGEMSLKHWRRRRNLPSREQIKAGAEKPDLRQIEKQEREAINERRAGKDRSAAAAITGASG